MILGWYRLRTWGSKTTRSHRLVAIRTGLGPRLHTWSRVQSHGFISERAQGPVSTTILSMESGVAEAKRQMWSCFTRDPAVRFVALTNCQLGKPESSGRRSEGCGESCTGLPKDSERRQGAGYAVGSAGLRISADQGATVRQLQLVGHGGRSTTVSTRCVGELAVRATVRVAAKATARAMLAPTMVDRPVYGGMNRKQYAATSRTRGISTAEGPPAGGLWAGTSPARSSAVPRVSLSVVSTGASRPAAATAVMRSEAEPRSMRNDVTAGGVPVTRNTFKARFLQLHAEHSQLCEERRRLK